MRIPPMPQVCSGLLCTMLILISGCSNPSSQTLDSLTITATPSTVSVGGATTLKAVAHLSDGTTQDVTSGTQWTLSNPALATMSSSALTAKAPGTLTVQAAYVETAPAGTSPAAATTTPENLSASTQVTITGGGGTANPNTSTITWSAPAAVPYGTALSSTQLDATASVPGTFAYSPAAGTVLKVGTQTLSATFTPTDTATYPSATASVQLKVNQASPTITWATPAPIAAGASLSATQLDATANVPGTFMYSPAVGAVPAAGTQQLTAVFSPTDSTDYASVTAHTSLSVTSPGAPVGSSGGGTSAGTGLPTPAGCGGPTINLNSSMSQSTLQSTIASAPSCAMVVFAAGTYNITAPLVLNCGVTYTGPEGTPATAILNGSSSSVTSGNGIFTLWSNQNLSSPCTQPTTIEYLNFSGATTGIFVQTSFTNLTIQYNQFTSIPGSQNQTAGMVFESGTTTSNTASELTKTTITHNQIGDANSCISPTNVMADTDSPEDYEGACNGIVFYTSINGMTVTYNNFFHVSEGAHINCPNYANQEYPCEPPGGAITENMTVEYNDFSNIHRISWEEQAQQSGGISWEYNSEHDWFNPYFGSYGISMACCYNGTLAQPNLNASSNVVLFNTSVGANVRYGYGMEAGGNLAQYNNMLMQASPTNGGGAGLAYDCGPVQSMSNNTVTGSWNGAYIVNESGDNFPCGTDVTPAQFTGNVTGPTNQAYPSQSPTISPSAGAQSFPLTVTVTDPGFTSGSLPLSNTGIWYTTDGSTPVPGSGTAQYLPTGGTFVLSAAATVKAVGMWGAANQPTSYPSGYGFVPSNAVTAVYVASGSVRRPTGMADASTSSSGRVAAAVATSGLPAGAAGATLESVAITPSQPVAAIGGTTQLKALATFSDGSVKDVTADFGWQSSDERTVTVNASGLMAGVASGPGTISGSYQGLSAKATASSALGEVDWSGPIVITAGGTYSGNWQSTDSKTPAVMVATSDPVTIENSHIRGAGDLITTNVQGSNLTVRNSLGLALNAGIKGQPNGNFVEVSSPARLDVENNYVENARGGVIVHGYGGSRNGEQTIVIRANRARNLTGLLSDGNGHYLPGEGSSLSPAHFIQFDSVQSVPRIEVGWNEVVNYPGQSLVDDNIDLYRSSGTPNEPLEIHDTYIQGAYPYRAQDAYTGGGIVTKGASTDSAQEASAFNNIHDNQVIGTVNYGIKFAAGHDNLATNNRVISSGLLADGTKIAAEEVGLVNGGAVGQSASQYNNTMRDNVVGWNCWKSSCAQEGYRKDQFFPASPVDYSANSVIPARSITFNMEDSEYRVWLHKMSAAAVSVGPAF
jgi:Bacterial Ig-like domain (group 2)